MLNRYTKLPEYVVKNNQVLTDLGIIDTALQRKQKQYDTKAASLGGAVQGAEAIPVYGDFANTHKTKVVGDLKNKVNEISSSDLADPNVTKGVDQYIQQASSDPELKKHIQAATLHNDYLETQKKLAESGKLPSSADKLRQLAWNQYSKDGTLSSQATEPLYEAQDLLTGRDNLVKNIQASGHSGTSFLNGIAYGSSSKGISYNQLGKAVQNQIGTYARSIYGKQEHDDFTVGQLEGTIPKDMKFEDYLIKQVMSTAGNRAYSNSSNDYSAAYNKKAEDDKAAATIPTETHGFDYSNGNSYEFTDDGQFASKDMASHLPDWMGMKNAATTEEMDEHQKATVDIAKKNNLTPAQVAEHQKQYRTVPFNMYTKGQGKNLSETLPAISTSQKITIGGETTTLGAYLEKTTGKNIKGMNTDDRKKMFEQLQVVGEVKPKNGLTTGYVIGSPEGQVILDVTDHVLNEALTGDKVAKQKAITTLDSQADEQLKRGLPAHTILHGKSVVLYPNLKNPGFHEGGFYTN